MIVFILFFVGKCVGVGVGGRLIKNEEQAIRMTINKMNIYKTALK